MTTYGGGGGGKKVLLSEQLAAKWTKRARKRESSACLCLCLPALGSSSVVWLTVRLLVLSGSGQEGDCCTHSTPTFLLHATKDLGLSLISYHLMTTDDWRKWEEQLINLKREIISLIVLTRVEATPVHRARPSITIVSIVCHHTIFLFVAVPQLLNNSLLTKHVYSVSLNRVH